jgi:hypothetical protein
MTYPEEILEKAQNIIESFIITDLADAKIEVRQIARHCFIRYKELFPQKARSIYFNLDTSV